MSKYLGISVGPRVSSWVVCSGRGDVQRRGISDETLADLLKGRLNEDPDLEAVGFGMNPHREAELSQIGELRPWLRTCSWNDGVLAGALVGQPGLLVSLEWSTAIGGKALILSRDARHQTRVNTQREGGLEWLVEQALALPGQLSGLSAQRVQKALGGFGHTDAESPEGRARIRQAVENLADYPGPEPACLALLTKTARRLTDFVALALSRSRLAVPARAVWTDGPLDGPLWTILHDHCQKALPELRWAAPAYPPEMGIVLLLLGEQRELERQNLNPQLREPLKMAPRGELSQEAWRHLTRGVF
jgi:hypothetical protein